MIDDYTTRADNLLGLGIGVSYRRYMSYGLKPDSRHKLYVAANRRHLISNIKYDIFEHNNSNLGIETKALEGHDKYNLLSLKSYLGDRILLGKFIFDTYFGMGYNWTKKNSNLATAPGIITVIFSIMALTVFSCCRCENGF